MTQDDVDLMNFWTTEAVDAYGYEPDEDATHAFCYKCKETIKMQDLFDNDMVHCKKCDRIYT
jgi:hypothetical protein